MSAFEVYIGEGGAKLMRPVNSRAAYLALRNSNAQRDNMKRIRAGEEQHKRYLLQMNYSCMPNEDGSLKGSKILTNTVGMDVDHIAPEEMQAVRQCILDKKDELGLLMLEESARGAGYHLVFRRRKELDQEGNLKWASQLLGVAYDTGAKDLTRVFYTTSEGQLIYLDDALFEQTAFTQPAPQAAPKPENAARGAKRYPTSYHGVPFDQILKKYWEVNNGGFEPTEGDRDTLTLQLASDLRHICGKKFDWLDQVIPCYDGFSLEEKQQKIRNALNCKYEGFPQRLRDTLNALRLNPASATDASADDEGAQAQAEVAQIDAKKLPQGVRESVVAVGPALAMPMITAVCPCIGALATGVKLDVHGKMRGLNLIAYIVGEFASRKGDIDPVIDTWMNEISQMDKMYQNQEEEYRRKKLASKNKKDQPEEPKLPVRFIPLNNTVANLAERLANVEGKHAFSFTPEADTVAQKWRSAMCDFSVMLRQSYDGSRYDREAKSAEAVNVHIEHLLWNVVMCGTPDALYRVVTNYTDGFQSRIALSHTPDNTYSPLESRPYVLTERLIDRIQQVAHLLPLMTGEVTLPRLEARGRAWLERIRLESMMNDDRVKARERFRTCVTAQRMVCCLMLCKVCELLIQKHGLNGAETQLKQQPTLWKEMLLKVQTPTMLDIYDVIADSLLEDALFFFRERIENAYRSRAYSNCVSGIRSKHGKNDTIYERLDCKFSFEQALQFSVAVKGADISRNSVRQMLKNWRNQGLVVFDDDGGYRKKSA